MRDKAIRTAGFTADRFLYRIIEVVLYMQDPQIL